MTGQAYRVAALGQFDLLVTAKRRYVVQTKGKLAAISIPTAEINRLMKETEGDLSNVLTPLKETLAKEGYSDLFIFPAQTKLVELIPCKDEVKEREFEKEALYYDKLTNLVSVVKNYLNASPNDAKLTRTILDSTLAELELLKWET